jgi:hypothetical protein
LETWLSVLNVDAPFKDETLGDVLRVGAKLLTS